MSPMFVMADLYAKGSLHKVAYSARPGAPVQPVAARRRFSLRRRGNGMPEPRHGPSPGLVRRPGSPRRPAISEA